MGIHIVEVIGVIMVKERATILPNYFILSDVVTKSFYFDYSSLADRGSTFILRLTFVLFRVTLMLSAS